MLGRDQSTSGIKWVECFCSRYSNFLLLSYSQDARKESKHKNKPEARIVKNVVDQKNKLQLRFGSVWYTQMKG